MPEVRRSYWAQLPSEVRYSVELSSTAKLLYAELSALIGEDGYCWATNTYFAGVLGVSERTISRMHFSDGGGRVYTLRNGSN